MLKKLNWAFEAVIIFFLYVGTWPVLRIMYANPSATQKEIAAAIGKSERTVKTITVALQEKLIVKRVNGKRNGYWEFVE